MLNRYEDSPYVFRVSQGARFDFCESSEESEVAQ
jgi:hypothetical protein